MFLHTPLSFKQTILYRFFCEKFMKRGLAALKEYMDLLFRVNIKDVFRSRPTGVPESFIVTQQ